MAESVQVWTEVLNCAWLTLLMVESPCGDNNNVVGNVISFLESLGSPLLDAYVSSYGARCAAV